MKVLLDRIAHDIDGIPRAQLPVLIAALAALSAQAQLRLVVGDGKPIAGDGQVLTVPEVAQRLKMSSYRVYELARHGTLQSQKYGKSVRVTPAAVADYLAHQGA